MYEIDINGLDNLMATAREGLKYAWDHYDELAAREHSYVLYGPLSPPLGACMPSNLVPHSCRNLRKTTRRKEFTIYQLDKSFRVLRTVDMVFYSELDYICHHFELNDLIYACPFKWGEKKKFNDRIFAYKLKDGKPVFFMDSSKNYLYAEFCEYVSADKMNVTSYSYWPNSKYTQFGYLADRNAPLGALNSPVQWGCHEEEPAYIEFSHWFK